MSRERDEGSSTITKVKKNNNNGSFLSIFMHADRLDMFLMVLGFIGAMADGFSTPLLTLVMARLMNTVGNASNLTTDEFTHKLYYDAVIILYVASLGWIAAFLEAYCWTRTGERQATRMRAIYLKAVLRQEVGYFDLCATSTAEIISSVSNDTLIIQDVISEKLVIVGLPCVVLLVVLGLTYGRTLMVVARKMREEYNKADTIVEQAISSVRTVYAFVGESKTINEFSSALQDSVKLGLKQGLGKGFASGINAITYAIWSFLAYYGGRLVMYHGAKGGFVFAAGTTIVVSGQALGAGLSNLKYISEATSAGEHIRDVIKRVPDIDSENMEGEILEKFLGEVEFRNVVFAYPSRPETIIFKDFCLKVPAGNTVALVGGSGSGKSTVVSLLQRFYRPLGGEILLDGVPIDKLQLKWLRSQMGLVSQEPALFATSIKENILFGKEDASMEEIIEAAKASNAHNFICQLPQQYDTQVGERGVQMSGGQKQRIAIARAIIKSPRILLLDEATSALDSESERVVQEALENAAVGRTTIVIAHRLSTIRSADVIVVIQNGQVMETGSHDVLIQDENGLYTALVNLHQTEKANTNPEEKSNMNLNNANLHSLSVISNLADENSASSCRSRNSFSPSRAYSEDDNRKENNSEEHNNKLTAPSFRRLLALNIPEWKQASLGCLSAVLFGAVQPVYAFAMGSMISQYYFAYMGEYLTKRIRENMLSKILTFEVGWFDQDENSSGAICSRLAKDANVVRSLVGDRVALLVQTFSSITIAFTMSLIISWRLALVIIAVQPLVIVCLYGKEVLLKSMSKKVIKAQDESSKLAAEAVSNLRTINAFSSQERILKMLEKAQEAPRREGVRQSWIAGVCLAFSRALVSCVVALAFWYGGRLVGRGYIDGKSLFEIFLVLVSTGKVIADAGTMTTDIAKGSDAVASVFAVLDRHTKIDPDDLNGYQPEKIIGHIELEDVHFAYPARPNVMIFKGFSINIEAKKSTALVGQSGSGKSTIIGLIERFYDPLKGVVKIDGRDIRSHHLRSLRRHIALVSQEPALFAGTIRENITYGASDKIDESEIIEAGKAANAHDFIAGLYEGYDTWCGDRGLQLSGGQKQRIAIARAVLKNPAVLLLDEATSALDSQSEKVVQEALERLMVERTSVVVAHRLSTIQNCDIIAVLEQGRVVEEGSHQSLLAKGPAGAYYSLVSLQTTPQN
ncbi:ABC transporter B family member 15 [Citrus sinensis]|nr:ABC transporter B family member 15 [Citrus sinensis]